MQSKIMAQELQRLKTVRKQAKASITSALSFLKGGIECNKDPSDDSKYDDYESKYLEALSIIEELLQNDSQVLNSSGNDSGSIHRLPPINICSFSGDVSCFHDFINLFNSIIHKNSKLSQCDKFYYLKSFLEGEAADLIRHLTLSSENYVTALNLLDERYNNKVKIINHHINSILDIKVVTKCTAPALREIISKTRQHLGALSNLEIPVQHWDLMIISILQRKLDTYTLRSFHLELKDTLPNLDLFLKFLEQRASALETIADNGRAHDSLNSTRRTSLVTSSSTSKPITCKFCNSRHHRLHQCEKFKLALPSDRVSFVTTHKLCQLCLRAHTNKCKHIFRCSVCKEKHNSLLHHDGSEKLAPKQVALSFSSSDDVLLPTVKVKLYDSQGNICYARALCDSGSQVSFILSDLAEKMGCKLLNKTTQISGICDSKNKVSQQTKLRIFSSINNTSVAVTCNIVKQITCDMPQFSINKGLIQIPSHVALADPEFDKTDKISMLLGCDIFFQILMREQIPASACGLYLQNTTFGYVVGGRLQQSNAYLPTSNTACILRDRQPSEPPTLQNDLQELEKTLQQFWEAEKVPETYTEGATEYQLAESIFHDSVTLKDERFQVDLPLKQNLDCLNMGSSLSRALIRFHNLEKRFARDPALFEKYKGFIEEYISLGHAQYIDVETYDLECGQIYFLPHHPVINENNKTTKLRVVFDGSMVTSLGFSLNDMLLNGPNVQNELFNIMIMFRLHKFVLIADIQKMFRQIKLNPSHCLLQNILWRNSPNETVKTIQLQTVTYGLKSSTFLSTRCLMELAHRYKHTYPLGASILLNNTYVDDVNIGHNDSNILLEMKKQLTELLKLGGFSLHKWCSNSQELINDVPKELKSQAEVDLCKDKESFLKTLGISYNPQSDVFNITSPECEPFETYTKRQVLSFVSKLFDPLGLVGPIVVLAKVIMQKTWLLKINWDSPLPEKINNEFKKFVDNLTRMSAIKVSRNINTHNVVLMELVGFADASSKAYGCCVYLRTIGKDGIVNVNLLCSKSRINPIKPLSVPRLELSSALLLAKLINKLKMQFRIAGIEVNTYLYLDSQVALAWLQTMPTKLSVYVANRVKLISQLTETCTWLYVSTTQNPADCLSRGVEAHLLQNIEMWWSGPVFLKEPTYSHEVRIVEIPDDLPDVSKTCNIVTQDKECDLFTRFSDVYKLKRVVAHLLRFINNCKTTKDKRVTGQLSCRELDYSLKHLIKLNQRQHFDDELKSLSSGKPIKSNLKSLTPFVDSMGVMRVGGRLQNADIPFHQKHPIILPKRSILTQLIIRKEHLNLMHAGQKLVLASLNQRYYIVNGLREVKHIIHKCIICFKLKAKASEQLMGSLPSDRVNPSRPFERIGIDFGGPYQIKLHRVRKPIIYKAYILLIVCFVTKAVHIELVTNLSTECFLQALKRFIFRRNKPSIIYCDNGSTFRGANNRLTELYDLQTNKSHQDAITRYATDQGIEFSFIPSYSPIFGGLWEAGIKSAKHYLKRVVGAQILTYEELNTVIVQIEGILNSRPLFAMPSADPNDMSYLTPSHFLTGASLTSYPEEILVDVPINRLSFWKQCSQMVQCFWKAWSKQYLTQLQNRPKWHQNAPNIEPGALVLLRDKNVSPLEWPMGRVVQTFPGTDGKVRAVSVKTSKGFTMRTSLMKVCVLPINDG